MSLRKVVTVCPDCGDPVDFKGVDADTAHMVAKETHGKYSEIVVPIVREDGIEVAMVNGCLCDECSGYLEDYDYE